MTEQGTSEHGLSGAAEAEAYAGRIQELSARAVELSRQNGLAWLDAYEQLLENFLKVQEQAAGSSHIDWVNTLVQSNADLVRQMSKAYFGAARSAMDVGGPV
jgi:hypothetical protein